MSEHLTEKQVRFYRERTISPAERLRLGGHVAACAQCRDALTLTPLESQIRSLAEELDSESEHLSYEQLVAYVDSTVEGAEAEIAESHLAACPHCDLLLSDLSAFKDEVKANLGKEYLPPTEISAPPKRSSLYESLSALFAFNSRAWAAALGVLVLLSVGLIIWLQSRSNQSIATRPEVVQSGAPAPSASPQGNENPAATSEPLPQATPPVLLALNDGSKQVTLDERGNLTGLEDLPPAYRQMIKTALISQRVAEASTLTELRGKTGSLRGGANNSNGFGPADPVGVVILTTRPSLRWKKLDGAIHYTVSIYDAKFNLVASSPKLAGTSWTVPSALTRGHIYTWQVTAVKEGQEIKAPVPPAAEARFKVLEEGQAAELNRARQSFPGSHLTLGILYAQAGLLDEAEREFLILLRENPQSKVAQNLLQSVRGQRRGR